MEPSDPGIDITVTGAVPSHSPTAGLYYGAGVAEADHHAAASFQSAHAAAGLSGELGPPADFMQQLNSLSAAGVSPYMGQGEAMPHHEPGDAGANWLGEHAGLHPGFLPPDFDYT